MRKKSKRKKIGRGVSSGRFHWFGEISKEDAKFPMQATDSDLVKSVAEASLVGRLIENDQSKWGEKRCWASLQQLL